MIERFQAGRARRHNAVMRPTSGMTSVNSTSCGGRQGRIVPRSWSSASNVRALSSEAVG